MATYSSILAWRIPWIEEPGGLQSMGVTKSQTMTDTTVLNAFLILRTILMVGIHYAPFTVWSWLLSLPQTI